MVYQHPLAYLLGLEGVALLRAFAGDYDRDFTDARIADMRALLDSVDKLGEGVDTPLLTTADGYDSWSEGYDEPGNGLIDTEQPIVWKILDSLPVGVALDAACGGTSSSPRRDLSKATELQGMARKVLCRWTVPAIGSGFGSPSRVVDQCCRRRLQSGPVRSPRA